MERFNAEIYRLKTFIACFAAVFITLVIPAPVQAQDSGVGYNVRFPFYQGDSPLPIIILYSEIAKPVGVRIELNNVRLDWIGDSIKDIQGVIKTPSAVYDKSTQKVTGNQKITFRSNAMDLDGEGFDIDQVEQIIHIRSNVKVVLKQRLKTEKGAHRKLGKGKISLAKSRQHMSITPIVGKKTAEVDKDEEKVKQEIALDRNKKTDWSTWGWLIAMAVIAGIIILILSIRHKKKRKSGNKS
jgi:hypothetical protein